LANSIISSALTSGAHSALMPAARISLPHVSVSTAMSFANACGDSFSDA
jgi:hypothetical protein